MAKKACVENASNFRANLVAIFNDSDDVHTLLGFDSELAAERVLASDIAMNRILLVEDPFKEQVFLSAAPTSTPSESEQLFSLAGIMFEPKQSQLSVYNVEMLYFLKNKLSVLKFQYNE